MKIIERVSRQERPVIINLVDNEDYKLLTEKRYSFSWESVKEQAVVYKLQIKNEEAILGVMGLVDVPEDKRMEIKLLANSIDNQGKNKIYEGIAGCLIAFACRLALAKYRADACVSLIPKTDLIKHYIEKYYMLYGGKQLYLENKSLDKILDEYE